MRRLIRAAAAAAAAAATLAPVVARAAPPAGNPDGIAPVPVEARAVDTSNPDVVIGTGTAQSCTSAAVVAAVAQAAVVEQSRDLLFGCLVQGLKVARCKHRLFPDAIGKKLVVRVLEDIAHLAGRPRHRHVFGVLAQHLDLATRRLEQPHQAL